MKNITFLEKDNDYKNEQTKYWFDVDGTSYCIADQCGDLSLLDEYGYPIEDCNDHDSIKDALIPHYEEHLLD